MLCGSWTSFVKTCRADCRVAARFTVVEVLRRFLPGFLKTQPPLAASQHRALWAITHCRTPALGGQLFACPSCTRQHFAFHSCNHKACPLCGSAANATWVRREQRKLVNAPYFLVTFTLPAELRGCFFGPHAKEAYDLFFAAGAGALSEKLATDKGLRAASNGFTAVLHTWNQQLGFHPHLHCLVPGVGLNARGKLVRVKAPEFLVYLPKLQCAFRQHFYRRLKAHDWQVDPAVWNKDWGKARIGFELSGKAKNFTSGKWFDFVCSMPDNKGYKINSAIVVTVTRIKKLLS